MGKKISVEKHILARLKEDARNKQIKATYLEHYADCASYVALRISGTGAGSGKISIKVLRKDDRNCLNDKDYAHFEYDTLTTPASLARWLKDRSNKQLLQFYHENSQKLHMLKNVRSYNPDFETIYCAMASTKCAIEYRLRTKLKQFSIDLVDRMML